MVTDLDRLARDACYQAWRYYYHFDNTWSDYEWDTAVRLLCKEKDKLTDECFKWVFFDENMKQEFESSAPSMHWISEEDFKDMDW